MPRTRSDEFTTTKVFRELMDYAKKTGETLDITNAKNSFGEPMKRNTITGMINRLTSQSFPNNCFYTRTVEGRLVLGCRNPDKAAQ